MLPAFSGDQTAAPISWTAIPARISRMSLIGRTLVAASALLVLAACGSAPIPASKSITPVTKVQQLTSDDLRPYFDSYATGDPTKMDAARTKIAAPGSLADAYLIFQAASASAGLDAGQGTMKNSVTNVNGGFKLCYTNPAGQSDCGTYANFKAVGGKLSSFTINGLDPAPRLRLGTGKAVTVPGFGTVRFVSSYVTIANYLVVELEIRSGGADITLLGSSATYRAPSGHQSTAVSAVGPSRLVSNSTAAIEFAFEKVKPGGVVTLTLNSHNDSVSHDVQIDVG